MTEEQKRVYVENEQILAELIRDANRYRFLRINDNWGEDSGWNSWEALAEASGVEFDMIVDSRIEDSAK